MDINQVRSRGLIIHTKSQVLLRSQSFYRPSPIQILLWVVFLAICVTASLSDFFAFQVGTNSDDARYLILSRSLVYSDRFGMLNVPGEPAPERYPFGYPLLISPFARFFPDQLDLPKVLSLVATVLNITLLFWGWSWFCRRRSYWWGVAITGLYAVSPVTVDLSRRIMSEPVFITFCLIAILLTEMYVQGKSSKWLVAGLSVALTFVIFTRTIGVVLATCIFIYLLYWLKRKAWKNIVKILIQMGLLVSLIVVITPVRFEDLLPLEYLKDKNARFLVTILAENPRGSIDESEVTNEASTDASTSVSTPGVAEKLSTIRQLLTFGIQRHFGTNIRVITLPLGVGGWGKAVSKLIGNSPLPLIFGFVISTMVIFGFIRLLIKEGPSLFILFAIPYLAALFFWIWNNIRLLHPIQPQIQLAWLVSLEAVMLWFFKIVPWKSISNRITPVLLSSLVIVMLAISIPRSYQIPRTVDHAGDLRVRSEWLRANLKASDVTLSEEPEIDYLYSVGKTIPYPEDLSSTRELEDYLIRNQVSYILVAPHVRWFPHFRPIYSDMTLSLLPYFDALEAEDRIQLVYSSGAGLIRVYQVAPSD